jgi:hypothetical protein
MRSIHPHRLLVLILFLGAIQAKGQVNAEVEGQSSIIIDNRKDILHVANSWYLRKLIEDATINAIRQAVPTIVSMGEYSYQDFDEADHTKQPSDRMIFQFRSGKQVQWQQNGNPLITPDLRTKRKWNCKVRGFAKEISVPVALNAPRQPVDPSKLNKQSHDHPFGLGYGLSLPQVSTVSLVQKQAGVLPSWELTIYPMQYIGVQFGVSRELSFGMYFSYTNIKLGYDSLETRTPCYGGRIQLGLYRHSVNPYFAVYALYGDENACAFGIKGAAFGIDFFRRGFKFGLEAMGYWVSSNLEHDGVKFSDDTFFNVNSGFNLSELRFNVGISLKVWFL